MISETTRDETFLRSGGICECGCKMPINRYASPPLPDAYVWHHILYRSQYRGTDRDLPWNGAALRHECHLRLHNKQNPDGERKLIQRAKSEKPPDESVPIRTGSSRSASAARENYRRIANSRRSVCTVCKRKLFASRITDGTCKKCMFLQELDQLEGLIINTTND